MVDNDDVRLLLWVVTVGGIALALIAYEYITNKEFKEKVNKEFKDSIK